MMKPLLVLPLALSAASCIPADPYYGQRPPHRSGEPYQPYRTGTQGTGAETGVFEPVPDCNRPPQPQPPVAPRPDAPRIDPRVEIPDTKPAPAPRPTYPEAKRAADPRYVISPYAPYNVIDVEGFKSGALAKDPSNGKIFRVP